MNAIFCSDVSLSILIVNYNGRDFLGPCLESIRKYVAVPFEVIVVDNASHDGSVDYLIKNYPDVRVIASQVNTGFSGGNNLAARDATGRYLLLLNNDTVVCSSIDPLIHLMELNEDAGVLGCRLSYGNGKQQESIGYKPNVLSLVCSWTPLSRLLPRSRKFRRTVRADSELYGQIQSEVEWVSGAFLLTRTELWRQLGGLDEDYFMYMEDTDYCERVRSTGNKILYSAACSVTHFEGAGRSWLGERAILNTTKSYLIYFEKFHGKFAVFLLRILLSQVFVFRSLLYLVVFWLGRDRNDQEKTAAYWRAAIRLIYGHRI